MKKILVSVDFGGFEVRANLFKDFMARTQGLTDIREDEELIALVEQGKDIGAKYSVIGLAEIPDNATDYEIIEYDGKESVLYVVDGKIRYAENRFYGEDF